MSDHWAPPPGERDPDLDLGLLCMGAFVGVALTLFVLWWLGVIHLPALRMGCA